MREGQYKKLKHLLHGRSNHGEEFVVFEYETRPYNGFQKKSSKPIKVIRRKLNKYKQTLPVHFEMQPIGSFVFDHDSHKRCSRVKRLRLSAAPSTSFCRGTIYDFTDEDYKLYGARVYKLHRKGE